MFINYDVSSEITDHNWPLIVSPPCLSSQGELIILTSQYSESVQLFCTVQYICTVTGNRMKARGIFNNPQGITTWPFNVAVLPDSQCWQDCLWAMGFFYSNQKNLWSYILCVCIMLVCKDNLAILVVLSYGCLCVSLSVSVRVTNFLATLPDVVHRCTMQLDWIW